MKKIIFDCERMKYENTGLYHYCLNLGRRIEKKLDSGTEALIFFAPPGAGITGQGAPRMVQHSLQKFLLPSLKHFDIWHCTYQNSDYIPFRNRKIKVVLSIHDLNFLYEPKTKAKRDRYLRHLQQNIDRSDVIICISDFCRRDVLTHCNVRSKPVHVIHNGTNNLELPQLSGHSYKPQRPFLFSLGVVRRKKNFHVLLPLLEQNADMELLIAGALEDHEYTEFIWSAARKLSVENKLRMLGKISEEEKSWYYHNCLAFALPSVAEGFGLPVAEAMSVGKPVFLSDCTALPEIGSNAAFYFRDFSAGHMQKVFVNGMKHYQQQAMQSVIRKRSASFCWDKAAEAYLNIYRSLY